MFFLKFAFDIMLTTILLQAALAATLTAVPDVSEPAADTVETVRLEEYKLLSFEAEDAQNAWDFAAAARKWQEAADACTDTVALKTIRQHIAECENGLGMQKFAYRPAVVARKRTSMYDFQLYYPLPDRAWRSIPNQLDSVGTTPYSSAIYAPEDSPQIFFSAPDSAGVRTVWETHFADSTWTLPEPAGCGPGAIYPMVYGNSLYFASDNLFGVGGYDIYVCRWNAVQRRWGPPENLGFPFNSPADDFLYARSGDGKYVAFASNRDCPAGNVDIFILKKEDMPVRQPVEGVEDLRKLCALEPVKAVQANAGPEDPATREYAQKLRELYSIRDSLARHSTELEAMRARYSGATGNEKAFLSSQISELEMQTPQMQARLGRVNRELAQIEQDLLSQGIIVNRENFSKEEPASAPEEYGFSRKSRGKPLKLKFF